MKHRILLLWGCFLFTLPLFSQHILITDSLFSSSINAWKKYHVLSPENSPVDKKVPVLYMLHGGWGNYTNWIQLTKFQEYAQDMDMIFVFPDAGNSFYVNANGDKNQNYADYILKDFMGHIEQSYPVDSLRRGIAGLSMGGYGAFYLACQAPERFIFSAGLSAALAIPGDGTRALSEDELKSPVVQMLIHIFGMPDTDIYPKYYPPALAAGLDPNGKLPYFYFVHGQQDHYTSFLPAHRELTEALHKSGILYEYHEYPGKHDWEFWDMHVRGVLEKFEEITRK
jgi:putative tributyrin esterase